MHDSYYVITCTNTTTYISNTLKNLLLQYDFHSSYNQTKYNVEEVIIQNIFSIYVEPSLTNINNPALVQECKLDIDAPEYEK